MTSLVRRAVPLLVRYPQYRRLWYARAVSLIGDLASYVALMLLVRDMTGGSGVGLAVLALAQGLPTLVVGPFAGVIADRFRRTRVMMASDLINAALFALLPLATTVPQVYAVGLLSRLALTFFDPSRQALLPDLVGQEDLVQANAFMQATFSAMGILAPALGGGLVAAFGYTPAFLINAASFLLSAVFVSRIQEPVGGAHDRRALRVVAAETRTDLAEGYRALARSAPLTFLFVVRLVASVGFAAFNVFEVLLVKDVLHGTDQQYGLFLAVCGLGGILGAILLPPLQRRWGLERLWAWLLLLGALTFFPYANVPHYGVVLAVVFVQTAALFDWGVLQLSLLQRIIPAAVRGRVFALFGTGDSLARMVVTLGFGLLVDHGGVVVVFNVVGVVVTLGGLYALRGYRRLPPEDNAVRHAPGHEVGSPLPDIA